MEQRFINIIKRQLLKDEKILWSGKPDVSRLFSKRDAFSIFFGMGFCVTSLVSIVGGINIMSGLKVEKNIRPDQGIIFILFGLSVTILGLYNIFGKAILRKYKRKRTIYSITNKRLLIFEVGANERVNSKYISRIDHVDIITRSNGLGTIKFGERYYENEFSEIKDVQKVYELVNNLINDENHN